MTWLYTILFLSLFLTSKSIGTSWQEFWRRWLAEQPAVSTRMYPFGVEFGDESASREARVSGFELRLPRPFRLFDETIAGAYVSVHGHVSFSAGTPVIPWPYIPYKDWPCESFPRSPDPMWIGPFYAEHDFRAWSLDEPARIFYRTLLQGANDVDDGFLRLLSADVKVAVLDSEGFTASHAIIITWYHVTFKGALCNSTNPVACRRNSYQMVLVGDDRRSHLVVNYLDVGWLGGTGQNCDPQTGAPSEPNFVNCRAAHSGMNVGSADGFHPLPYSQTVDMLLLHKRSGSFVPGRYFYGSVSSSRPVRGGCSNDSTVVSVDVQPRAAPMLGGTTVNVSGPCFLTPNVRCQFGDVVVDGSVVPGNRMRATCVVPELFQIGEIELAVSASSSDYFNYRTRFYIERHEENFGLIVTSSNDDFLSPDTLDLQWNRSYVVGDRANVWVYGYREWNGEAEWKLLGSIVQDVSNSGKLSLLGNDLGCGGTRAEQECLKFDMGVVVVTAVHADLANPQGVRSEVLSLAWFTRDVQRNLRGEKWISQRCSMWRDDDVLRHGGDWISNLNGCPCLLKQALVDFRFEVDSQCNIDSSRPTNCRWHKGAKHCVVSVLPTTDGAGSKCCYNQLDELMLAEDGPWAGGAMGSHPSGSAEQRRLAAELVEAKQRNAHHISAPGSAGRSSVTLVGRSSSAGVASLSHAVSDGLPFFFCCLHQIEQRDCRQLRQMARPTPRCHDYRPSAEAGFFGDPHFRTFDGTTYTFNGRGEFWIVYAAVNDGRCEVQARLEDLALPNRELNASVVSSVVLRETIASSQRTVQFELRSTATRSLRILVDGREVDENVVVARRDDSLLLTRSSDDEFSAIFRSCALTIRLEPLRFLSGRVSLDDRYRTFTNGLLGDWNDQVVDDLQPQGGGQSIPSDDMQRVHYEFGLTWSTKAAESLFVYRSLLNHAHYNQQLQSFVPPFRPATSAPAWCDGNVRCAFDFERSDSQAVAENTKHREAALRDRAEERLPIATCPPLRVPFTLKQEPVSLRVASRLSILGCISGFKLSAGATSYVCENDADPRWWPDVSVACLDERSLKRSNLLLLIYVVVPIVLLLLLLLLILLICCCRRRRRNQRRSKAAELQAIADAFDQPVPKTPMLDTTPDGHAASFSFDDSDAPGRLPPYKYPESGQFALTLNEQIQAARNAYQARHDESDETPSSLIRQVAEETQSRAPRDRSWPDSGQKYWSANPYAKSNGKRRDESGRREHAEDLGYDSLRSSGSSRRKCGYGSPNENTDYTDERRRRIDERRRPIQPAELNPSYDKYDVLPRQQRRGRDDYQAGRRTRKQPDSFFSQDEDSIYGYE